MDYNFNEIVNRFGTPSAKFNSEFLLHFFGTDDLYPFWVADMDIKCPPTILEAFDQKVKEGVFGYEVPTTTYLPSIVNWYSARFHCTIEPTWIQFTPNIMSSVALAIDCSTEENHGIIILPPVYMDFATTIKKTNRTVIEAPLKLVNLHYEIDFEYLRKIATEPLNTAILLSNPHNPGGRVWTRNELKQIVDICIENQLILISDEIHADMVFSNGKFTSLLSFPEIYKQLVVCYSPGKIFNIASVTDSLAIIPNPKLRMKFKTLALRYNLGRTNAFARLAMEVGFTTAHDWVDQLIRYIEENKNYISAYLEEHIPQIQLVQQEGTYLVWLKVDELSIQGPELIKYLAQKAKIGVNDGAAFGNAGKGFVRMNISCPKAVLTEAMHKLKSAVDALTKN